MKNTVCRWWVLAGVGAGLAVPVSAAKACTAKEVQLIQEMARCSVTALGGGECPNQTLSDIASRLQREVSQPCLESIGKTEPAPTFDPASPTQTGPAAKSPREAI